MRRLPTFLALALVLATVPDILPSVGRPLFAATRPPNVIVILTDDQPIDTLQKMPHVLALAHRGMTFQRFYVSNPLCCPSRSTLLTGLYAGHTGVWNNGDGSQRWGGWWGFRHNGLNMDGTPFGGDGNNENRTVALYLQQAGYRTGLFGKYLNHYEMQDGSVPPVPVGWSSWHSFIGHNGAYYGYDSSDNGTRHHHGWTARDYSTDVFGRKAKAFLRAPAIQDGSQPFFMEFTPFAPHGNITPAPGDMDVRAPTGFESPAYNERDVRDKPGYVQSRHLIPSSGHARLADQWNRTYGTLASVDRWVGRFAKALPDPVRRRTVFIFSSDNGEAWGDHRLTWKGDPYERTVRVPLIVAGPGIVHGSTHVPTVNADLTPTILALAGRSGVGGPFDGRSLVPLLRGTGTFDRKMILLEHLSVHDIPSYCGVRARGWKYVLYRGGFQELYDTARDPWELHNVAAKRPHVRRWLRQRASSLCRPRPPDW